MKDEIKEILDTLGNKECYINDEMLMYFDDAKKLLDYITNLEQENQIDKYKTLKELQEENEELKEKIENLTTMTVCGDRKQIKNTAQYKLDIYKSRINKAIHRIQLLQMDNEVTVKDLGLIARDLTGGDE